MDKSSQPANTLGQTPEYAHVLFMDLVAYSKPPTERQVSLIRRLSEIVRGTHEFRQAQLAEQLISLHTGDGMALVFFQNPLAPAQSALEIAEQLKAHPDIKLRMGLHSGPVYRVLDINNHSNVAGPGINFAQRVMDSGDAGHILVSRSVADDLVQFEDWQEHLHDLGQHEVKHGFRIHLFNLWKGDLGCQDWPTKLDPSPVDQNKREALPIVELLQTCRGLFEELSEFRSPESLRPLFRVPPLSAYTRCVSNAASLDFDQLIDCLYRAGRSYRGQALIDLLEVLAVRYKDEPWLGEVCENLRDSLKQSLDQVPGPATKV